MRAVPRLNGQWRAAWAIWTFGENGTFGMAHRRWGAFSGAFRLTTEHPSPAQAVYWPVPVTGFFLRLDYGVPPDVLPWREVWAVDETSDDRLVLRSQPHSPLDGEYVFPLVSTEVVFRAIPDTESRP